jgi:uncharacterized protein
MPPRPVFSYFVAKLCSRCNLDCDYCYMYHLRDSGWMQQPKVMSAATLTRLAVRAGRYARQRGLGEVTVVWHGGEPLMAGAELLDRACSLMRAYMPAKTALRMSVTTNGILLKNQAILDVLLKHAVEVAVSLDGDAAAVNRHRKYRHGRGSYDDVTAGIEALMREPYGRLPRRFLSVIDPGSDPVAVYDAIARFADGSTVLDFALPLANWDTPPARPSGGPDYGYWLAALYDHWRRQPSRPAIRTFRVLEDRLQGTDTRVGFIGPQPDRAGIVINTDGSLERLDSLRAVEDGMVRTGRTVRWTSFRQAERLPFMAGTEPCPECRACPLFGPCGGGYFVDRYRSGSGFGNPSVYCADMKMLIPHIAGALPARQAAGPGGRS